MITVSVYHSAFGDIWKHVANVNVGNENCLHEVYRLTNSIDCPWWENEEVERVFEGDECRSTSVGDFIKVDGEFYRVDDYGFSAVRLDEEFKLMYYNKERTERFYTKVALGELVSGLFTGNE